MMGSRDCVAYVIGPRTRVFAACFFICLLHLVSGAVFFAPEQVYVPSPPLRWYKANQEPVSGQLIPFRWENTSTVAGKIAFTRASQNVSEHLLFIQQVGAIGIILYDNVSDYAGSYDLESPGAGNLSALHLHVVQIGVIDRDIVFNLLYRNGSSISEPNNVTVHLRGDPALEYNYWTIVRTNGIWYFVQVLLCAVMSICASLALYKLLAFIVKDGRIRLSVAQMALFIEYIQNMIRLIFWALDPIWLLRGAFSWTVTNVLVTVHHPLFICSTLLLALYWHQLLKFDRVKISVGLNKMRIPFAIVAFVLVVLEIVVIALRSAGISVGDLTTASGALISVVAFAVSVYFVFIGIKVLGQLKGSSSGGSNNNSGGPKQEISENHKKLIRRTTMLIVFSAVLHIFFVLVAVLTTFRKVFWHPIGFYTLLSFKDLILAGISLCQILTFRAPGSAHFQSSKSSLSSKSRSGQSSN